MKAKILIQLIDDEDFVADERTLEANFEDIVTGDVVINATVEGDFDEDEDSFVVTNSDVTVE